MTKVPYLDREISFDDHLENIVSLHTGNRGAPLWKKKFKEKNLKPRDICDLEDLLSHLGPVDPQILVDQPLLLKPEYLKRPLQANSSGTDDKKKTVFLSDKTVNVIIKYSDYVLSHVYNLGKNVNWLIQGPYGIFERTMIDLVRSRGGTPYFCGLETRGQKKIAEEFGRTRDMQMFKQHFAPVIEYSQQALGFDKNIKVLRTASPFALFFDELFGDIYRKGMEALVISGMNFSPQIFDNLKTMWKKVIPSYGYFASGDAYHIPIANDNDLNYYPNWPFVVFEVTDEDNKFVKYLEEGHTTIFVLRDDLLLISKEREFATKIPPTRWDNSYYFPWDGIRNPYRKL